MWPANTFIWNVEEGSETKSWLISHCNHACGRRTCRRCRDPYLPGEGIFARSLGAETVFAGWECYATQGYFWEPGREFMTAVVSLKNVVKRYTRGKQQVEVLHGLDLTVESGEFLALMGP